MLGAVLVEQAVDAQMPRVEREARLREAEELLTVAAPRLLVLAPQMGPKNRVMVLRQALGAAARMYEVWLSIEVTDERAARLAEWRARMAEFAGGG